VARGSLLWDAQPAGDRVRARWTYPGSTRVGRVQFAIAPGWLVRQANAPGVLDASWEGTAERPIWTARIEPPLPQGESIELELWRPYPGSSRDDDREIPRLEPLGVERWTAGLGLRRPDAWEGQLGEPPSTTRLSAEELQRSWGPRAPGAWALA